MGNALEQSCATGAPVPGLLILLGLFAVPAVIVSLPLHTAVMLAMPSVLRPALFTRNDRRWVRVHLIVHGFALAAMAAPVIAYACGASGPWAPNLALLGMSTTAVAVLAGAFVGARLLRGWRRVAKRTTVFCGENPGDISLAFTLLNIGLIVEYLILATGSAAALLTARTIRTTPGSLLAACFWSYGIPCVGWGWGYLRTSFVFLPVPRRRRGRLGKRAARSGD